MAKLIDRITLVALGTARGETETLYKAKKRKKKKKGSRWLRPFERMQRRTLDAQEAFFRDANRRHRKSNRKRRDGWLRDGGDNTMKSSRKAFKKIRKTW